MRETFSTLLQTTQNFCIDDSTSSTSGLTDTSTFLTGRINDSIQFLFNLTRNYKSIALPKTMTTVADQIYYHYPPGMMNIESVTLTIGDVDYPLRVINSQEKWDQLQELDITSASVPQYIFPRRDDFGIYPTVDDAYTVTLVGNYLPVKISTADYTTGTVSITQNDETVTGVGTTFTSAMIGRWFVGNSDGNWYRVASYSSATSIELESAFEGTSLSGDSYIIGQSPDLPEEMHQFIPYQAAASYYSTVRRDPEQAQRLLNYFYTGDYYNTSRSGKIEGGILNIINRYKNTGRSNSQLNRLHKGDFNQWRREAWAAQLSPSS